MLEFCISTSFSLNSFSISKHFFLFSFFMSFSKMSSCSLKSAGRVIAISWVLVGKTFNKSLNSKVILFCSAVDLKKNCDGFTSKIFTYLLSFVTIIPSLISFIGICCCVLCFLITFVFLFLFFPINYSPFLFLLSQGHLQIQSQFLLQIHHMFPWLEVVLSYFDY